MAPVQGVVHAVRPSELAQLDASEQGYQRLPLDVMVKSPNGLQEAPASKLEAISHLFWMKNMICSFKNRC